MGFKATVLFLAIILLFAAIGSVITDLRKNQKYKKIPSKPEKPLDIKVNEVLWQLENSLEVDFSQLNDTFKFIESRYDCSDFHLQSLLRIIYKHSDKLDSATKTKIKNILLNFKYWMDEPGEDSMCCWSENHQILFAAAEYLAGQLFPDDVFPNSGLTGRQHMEKARKRILTWLEIRWTYGFSEWYSNVYYVEDIAPLSNLIDFCKDQEIVKKSQIILDLLMFDIASQSFRGNFITTSGRLYENHKKSGNNASTIKISEHVWGYKFDGDRFGMELNFIYANNYRVPQVIREIGLDPSTVIIKASNGLDVKELKKEGLIGLQDKQIMMQWGMEAFTNPEVINNSISIIEKYNMFKNEFLNEFKSVNITLLKKLGLLPLISRVLNPQTNGVALQRANTYTYKTDKYSLSTAQKYHPGEFADQQHIWQATLGKELSIFTTHPATPLTQEGAKSISPGYWVGSGRLPHSVQDKNVNMTLYVLPARRGFMEKALLQFTHAYFPREIFHEVVIDNNYAFGRYGDVYVALIAKNPLKYREGSTDDLIQEGRETYWICEISTKDDEGSFESFIRRIKSNAVYYRNKKLQYTTNNILYQLEFGKDFCINGQKVETEYPRLDSPYGIVQRKPEIIELEFNGKKLYLDFYNMIRQELP